MNSCSFVKFVSPPFLFHFKSLDLNIPRGEKLLAREIGTGILLVD